MQRSIRIFQEEIREKLYLFYFKTSFFSIGFHFSNDDKAHQNSQYIMKVTVFSNFNVHLHLICLFSLNILLKLRQYIQTFICSNVQTTQLGHNTNAMPLYAFVYTCFDFFLCLFVRNLLFSLLLFGIDLIINLPSELLDLDI